MKLNNREKQIITLLLQAEKSTVRFLTGFGEPSEQELIKEKFLVEDDLRPMTEGESEIAEDLDNFFK